MRRRLVVSWCTPFIPYSASESSTLQIIRSQVFLVSILASVVSFVAFRERAYRYSSAKALGWVTLEAIDKRDHDDD